MPKAPENLREFAGLLKVVESLRGPDGCPWDKEQTHQSLTRFAIEEAHELAEAIDSNDARALRAELGDVLLQVVLHSEIARQAGAFDIFDVIQGLNEKMVRRHPHVFASAKADTSEQVLTNWAEIKAAEKKAKGKPDKLFDIPQGLPALLRAHKIGEKTTKLAFDFDTADQAFAKVDEENAELREAVDAEDHAGIESELGDVLFSVVQAARLLGVDSEQALRKTNLRFEKRFEKMQELVKAEGRDWKDLAAEDKEKYWKAAKA